MFLIVLLLGATIGLWARKTQRHVYAREKLEPYGHNGFEDPIGPNWLYTWDFSEVPGNGRFPDWFSGRFCVKGSHEYWFIDQQIDLAQWRLLEDLDHLWGIRIQRVSLPDGWVATLCQCKELKGVDIFSMPLSVEDIDSIGRLNVSVLGLHDLNLTTAERERLLTSLCKLKTLKNLALTRIGASREDIDLIRKSLPTCQILE